MTPFHRANRLLPLALATVVVGCHSAPTDGPPTEWSVVGQYRVAGMEKDGAPYVGLVSIDDSAGPGEPLRIRGTIGRDRFQGSLEPAGKDRLTLRFRSTSASGGGDYRILGRDRIEGRWWAKDGANQGWEAFRRVVADWTPPRVVERYAPMSGSIRIGPAPDNRVAMTDRGYTMVLPADRAPIGMAVFFDGWRVKVDSLPPAVGSFEDEALRAGVGLLHLTTGNPVDFLFTDDDAAGVVKRVEDALAEQGLADRPLLFAGLSLGGTRALRVAVEVRRHRRSPLRLAAVAVVDAPLDMIRMWNAEAKAARDGFHPSATDEGRWVSYLLEANLGGTPVEARARYVAYSPYVFGEPGGGNAAVLKDLPLRAYHEPDVDWWIHHRGKSYYQMNSIDLAALVDELQLDGSKTAELITTSRARDGYDAGASPHTWSIVDNADLVRWFVGLIRG
jgi:hypothetical protein